MEPRKEMNNPYQEDKQMTSVVSAPRRGPWGNPKFRGNCDGTLIKNLVLRYGAKRVADPMAGSGTTRDVIAGLNATGKHRIKFWGSDLREGFDLRSDPLPGQFDFVWLHPPYFNMIRYSDDPRDWLRQAFPSYGPDWDAAIEYGVDVSLLEENLKRTPSERLDALQDMLDFVAEFRGAVHPDSDETEAP